MLKGPSNLELDKGGYQVFLEFGQSDGLFYLEESLSTSRGHGPWGGGGGVSGKNDILS